MCGKHTSTHAHTHTTNTAHTHTHTHTPHTHLAKDLEVQCVVGSVHEGVQLADAAHHLLLQMVRVQVHPPTGKQCVCMCVYVCVLVHDNVCVCSCIIACVCVCVLVHNSVCVYVRWRCVIRYRYRMASTSVCSGGGGALCG
jgi:hypothetical protein